MTEIAYLIAFWRTVCCILCEVFLNNNNKSTHLAFFRKAKHLETGWPAAGYREPSY